MRNITAEPLMLYGIKNCDTVKKAHKYLLMHECNVDFHDFRAEGIALPWLHQLVTAVGLSAMVNTRSTTWRNLSSTEQDAINHPDLALQLLQQHPTLIKRPILQWGQHFIVGFSESRYTDLLREIK